MLDLGLLIKISILRIQLFRRVTNSTGMVNITTDVCCGVNMEHPHSMCGGSDL